MPVAGGLGSSIGIASESAVGTIVSPTRWLEYNSESLHLEKTTINSMGLRGGGLVARSSRRAYTQREAKGDVELEVATKGMGLIFQQMLGGTSASAVLTGSAYQQIHVPGSLTGRSLSVQKLVTTDAAVIVPFTYKGMKVTDWELSCAVGEIATLSLTFDGWDEVTSTGAGTPSYVDTAVFHFAQGAVSLGGTPSTTAGLTSISGGTTVATVRTASVTGTNPLATDRFFFGSAGVKAEQLENGWREYGGSLEAEFVSQAALYDAFAADSATTLKLSFVGTTAITGSTYPTLEVICPSIRLNGSTPQNDGPDITTMDVDFEALDDGTTNPAIQIRYVTADTSVS